MNPVAQQIAELTQRSRMIEAIKLLRRHTTLGLKEAKDLLEADASAAAIDIALQRDPMPDVALGVSDEVRQLAAGGQVIAAIKLLRDQTGLGLKEAKQQVDRLRPPSKPRPSKGLARSGLAWIAAAIALALAAWLLGLPLI